MRFGGGGEVHSFWYHFRYASNSYELPNSSLTRPQSSSYSAQGERRERWVPRKGAQGKMGREKSSPAPLPRAQLFLCRVLYEDDWRRVRILPSTPMRIMHNIVVFFDSPSTSLIKKSQPHPLPSPLLFSSVPYLIRRKNQATKVGGVLFVRNLTWETSYFFFVS